MVFRFLRGVARAERPAFALLQSVGVQVAVLFINLATGVISARLLGPDGRGVFSAVTTWPALLATVATAGLTNAVVFNLRRPNRDRDAVVAASFVLGFATATAAVAVGFIVLPRAMARYSPDVLLMTQICLLATYANVAHLIYKQVFAGVGAYRAFNIAQILPQLAYLVGLAGFALAGRLTATTAVIALVGGGALTVAAITPSFLKVATPAFRNTRAALGDLWSFTRRAAGADVIGAVASYADRLLLIPMISPAELGLYVVAYSFSRTIMVVQPAVSSVIFSSMSQRSPDEIKVLHDHAFRYALYGLAAVVAVLLVIDRTLLSLVYGPEFGRAVELFRILILEAAVGCLCYITTQLYLASDKPGYVSVVQMIGFGVSVAGMLVLIPRMGAMGAAWALLLAGLARLLLQSGGLVFYLRQKPTRLWPKVSDITYLRDRLR